MLAAHTPLVLFAAGLIALAAGFIKGFAGFGFALVFTPAMSLLSDHPRHVVFIALALGLTMSLGVLAERRDSFTRDRLVPVLGGTLIGTPIGIVLLGWIDRPALKAIIAGFAILVTFVRLFRLRLAVPPGSRPLLVGAVLGGVLNGCTSMGGPIPALIVSWQGRAVNESRAILALFNLLSYFLAIIVAVGAGIARLPWLIDGIWLLAPAAIGTIAGARAVQHASHRVYTHTITAMVGLAGVAGAIAVLGGS